MSPTRPELTAEDILAALNRRGVGYVVIGAFAAQRTESAIADTAAGWSRQRFAAESVAGSDGDDIQEILKPSEVVWIARVKR